MSRSDEGRISRPQSALEQLSQTFCAKTRETGGLLLSAIGLQMIFLDLGEVSSDASEQQHIGAPNSATPFKVGKISGTICCLVR